MTTTTIERILRGNSIRRTLHALAGIGYAVQRAADEASEDGRQYAAREARHRAARVPGADEDWRDHE